MFNQYRNIMKRIVLALLLCSSMAFAQDRLWINEIGLSFPVSNNGLKDYLNTCGISSLPLTSGLGTGVLLGRHAAITQQTTLGGVIHANVFAMSSQAATAQVYQLSALIMGRMYFSDTWCEGIFAELGGGAEASAASCYGAPFDAQVNLSSRAGLGYNFHFGSTATFGITAQITPTALSGGYFGNTKLIINMLW